MQDSEDDANSHVGGGGEEPVRIWVENVEGAIARGIVEVLSDHSAVVRLIGADLITSGNDVTVRIAVSRNSPTLGGAAHVRWVKPAGDDTSECELEWTHTGPERDQLACVVLSLS